MRRQVAGAEAFLNPGDGAQGSDVSQSSAIDTTTLSAIADTIVTAESVLCSGAGNSSALAEHFALRLLELGLRVTWLADAQAQLLAARLLGPSGTLVALSESARSPEVLAVASAAQASGASTNLITAAHRTPLTGLADHILRVPDDPTTPRPDWFGSRAIEGRRAPCNARARVPAPAPARAVEGCPRRRWHRSRPPPQQRLGHTPTPHQGDAF